MTRPIQLVFWVYHDNRDENGNIKPFTKPPELVTLDFDYDDYALVKGALTNDSESLEIMQEYACEKTGSVWTDGIGLVGILLTDVGRFMPIADNENSWTIREVEATLKEKEHLIFSEPERKVA